jgi:hypothetical protein
MKCVQVKIKELEKRKNDFAHAWENSLNHQLKNLPDFNFVYDKIIKVLENYENI